MANKQRVYLLRVDEKALAPDAKDYALRPCRRATNIAIRNEDFQPCVAVGGLPACNSSLVIWAACTNYLPVYLLKEHLCGRFPPSASAFFVQGLDTAVQRRAEDGLLRVDPEDGQYLVTDLTIKDVDDYINQQYMEYEQKHDPQAERLAELEAMKEAAEECCGYLDAWDIYQSEDDLDEIDEELSSEMGEPDWDWEEESDALDEEEPAERPALANDTENRVGAELAQLNTFAHSFGLHGEPLRLSENRNRLDRLLQQWQFSPFNFSPHEVRLLQRLLHHRVFHVRKAHCFKCKRHLYDHLDQTCLKCSKYQIICSDPKCGACGCQHDPSFARK